MKNFNTEEIFSIELSDKKICELIKYFKEQKSFWSKNMDAGFYCYLGGGLIPGILNDNDLYNYITIDKIAYYKPCVNIRFKNGDYKKLMFDTYDEAMRRKNDLLKQLPNATFIKL